MPSTNDYALLSNRVYFRTPINRTVVATSGWVEKQWIPDQALTGFSAGVYQKGNDIVISCTGTNERKAADYVFGNIPAATGLYPSDQVWAAMELYFQAARDNPTANITFTGHSLGGGLAAMMGVFFNRPAVVFDAAPFELGARSIVALPLYRAQMVVSGYSNAAFEEYWSNFGTLYSAREANVSGVYLQGEVLDQYRTPQSTIGTYLREPVGQTTANPKDLHSMTLLASMERSTEFADAVRQSPNLLAHIFDSSLYYRDPQTSQEPNFIDHLYIAQVSSATTPLLDRFAADVQQLTTAGSTAAQQDMQKALTVAAMDYYNYKDPASATGLFTTSNGAVNFSLADVGVATEVLKSPVRLADLVWLLSEDVGNFAQSAARSITSWHVQSGTAPMNWTGTDSLDDAALGGAGGDTLNGADGNDLLLGLVGADSLTGGTGTDILVGGDGSDVLDGGAGFDYLYGGAGSDTYNFTSLFGGDWVVDSDGQGTIVVDDVAITGADTKKIGDDLYSDGTWVFALVGDDLVLQRDGSIDSIRIHNWNATRNVGITLNDTPTPPMTTNTIAGDYIKKISESDSDFYLFDGAGNYQSGGASVQQDQLFGTAASDLIQGGGDNDALSGLVGDDRLEGGDGDDVLQGGLGADILIGGAGRDYLYGSGLGGMDMPRRTDFTPIRPDPTTPTALPGR